MLYFGNYIKVSVKIIRLAKASESMKMFFRKQKFDKKRKEG